MAVRPTAVSLLLVAFAFANAGAQTATQLVRFEVRPVNEMAVTGSPSLVVNSAVAGSGPASATHSGSAWAISTNESNQKIIASLDANLPAGLSLEVSLAAPAGAASQGSVPLSTSGADVVTGISTLAASALPVAYRLSATTAAPVMSGARTVTFTIVSGV